MCIELETKVREDFTIMVESAFTYFTLSIFGTKCEGKFVPDDCTTHVATEYVQCADLGWWDTD